MSTSRRCAIAVTIAASLGLAACGSGSSSSTSGGGGGGGGGGGTINGAGSTLAAPIYQQWASDLSSQGLTVNYQAAGSGAGVAQLQAGTVGFAGSDPPMKPTEIAAAKGAVAEFPIAFGGITVAYNLPGVKNGLKLDGPTIANIFLGKIKKWDDPALKALNPKVNLPSTPITVIHRSDASGTTKGFATFLSDYSPAWTKAAGQPDKTVAWPTGTGAKGSSGVAATIKQTAGGIGYVEQAYVLSQSGFTYAAVKNSSGAFILPTLPATSAAADGITVPADLTISSINSPNKTAYPIVSQTFLIVYKDMCKAGVSQPTAAAVKKFITYGLGPGQAVEVKLSYASLPGSLVAKDKAQLAELTCNGSPVP